MIIVLEKDNTISCDLSKIILVLSSICTTCSFSAASDRFNERSSNKAIDFEEERERITKKIKNMSNKKEPDLFMYVTTRPYEDNYYFHKKSNIMILSMNFWEQYTSLPIENGIFYFIADILALEIDNSSRHENTTGCIYDFLRLKTGVDLGMKMGYVCELCRKRLSSNLKSSKNLSALYDDVTKILDVLNNTSRWGKSVFYFLEDKSIEYLDWSTFEAEIAQFYRKLGAEVKQDVNLGGFQIDIFVVEETPSRQKIKTAIECKFHTDKIGNRAVNDFIRMVETLKQAGSVDKGIIVSYSGFTQDAHLVSNNSPTVELIIKG